MSCGATLLCQRNPFSSATAFGVWITRGSIDEKDSEKGLSHLLEHMAFRGTKRRSALQIALELESIGGHWDAYTGKESTCYRGKALAEHLGTLTDVLADVILNPAVAEEDFGLERKVVQEEIRSIRDSPEESVHEAFYEAVFSEHPLGYPVAGNLGDVGRRSRADVLAFHRRHYRSSNAVLAFAGNISSGRVSDLVNGKFTFRSGGARLKPRVVKHGNPRIRSLRRSDWVHSHLCAGGRTPPASSRERYAIAVLSNILGGGVSSRLFQSLREKRGLVYTVYTHTNFWRGAGTICTYFSVDPKNLGQALDIFHRELRDLRDGGTRREEVESARAQLKGAVAFGLESIDNRLSMLFRGEFYHGRYVSPQEVVRGIDEVDAADVTEAAGRYLREENLTYVTCGPVVLRGLVPVAGPRAAGI